MSKADLIFIQNMRNIIDNGFSDEHLDVRPRWLDGVPAHTKKCFCIVNRYNLKEEFPIITVRKTNLTAAIDEILWIWQKKSNNIHGMKIRNSHNRPCGKKALYKNNKF